MEDVKNCTTVNPRFYPLLLFFSVDKIEIGQNRILENYWEKLLVFGLE